MSQQKKRATMETLTATLATLVVIWVITCVAFYVHANTQDRIIASYRKYGARLVTERDTLANSLNDLLTHSYAVTAERDALRVERDAISSAYSKECHGAYADRQALNAMTTECNELRTELEQSKRHNTNTTNQRDAYLKECHTLNDIMRVIKEHSHRVTAERDRLMLAHIAITDNA
jgi:hypothetical protein